MAAIVTVRGVPHVIGTMVNLWLTTYVYVGNVYILQCYRGYLQAYLTTHLLFVEWKAPHPPQHPLTPVHVQFTNGWKVVTCVIIVLLGHAGKHLVMMMALWHDFSR